MSGGKLTECQLSEQFRTIFQHGIKRKFRTEIILTAAKDNILNFLL